MPSSSQCHAALPQLSSAPGAPFGGAVKACLGLCSKQALIRVSTHTHSPLEKSNPKHLQQGLQCMRQRGRPHLHSLSHFNRGVFWASVLRAAFGPPGPKSTAPNTAANTELTQSRPGGQRVQGLDALASVWSIGTASYNHACCAAVNCTKFQSASDDQPWSSHVLLMAICYMTMCMGRVRPCACRPGGHMPDAAAPGLSVEGGWMRLLA